MAVNGTVKKFGARGRGKGTGEGASQVGISSLKEISPYPQTHDDEKRECWVVMGGEEEEGGGGGSGKNRTHG